MGVLAWMKKVMVSIVVSVSIHLGGEYGSGVEGLGGAYVVWSLLQIYYLARGRQFVSAYALSMGSVTKIHMYKLIIVLMSEKLVGLVVRLLKI